MPKSKKKKSNTFLFDIHCAACNTFVFRYQKGGRGSLLRCFINGILMPDELVALQAIDTKDELPNLTCPECSQLIGVPMVYKDGRLAFRMIYGAFQKKKV